MVIVTPVDVTDPRTGAQIQINIANRTLIARGSWGTVYRANLAPRKDVIAIKEVTCRKYRDV